VGYRGGGRRPGLGFVLVARDGKAHTVAEGARISAFPGVLMRVEHGALLGAAGEE